jgi:hypothetical protein
MKMLQHCTSSLPTLVTGALLGLDVDGVLQVTNCFPQPGGTMEDGGEEKEATTEPTPVLPEMGDDMTSSGLEGEMYQMEMMKAMVSFPCYLD